MTHFKKGISVITGLYLFWYAFHLDDFSLISVFNLIIHEAGHSIFFWAPEFITILAGSAFQITFPLIFILYFWNQNERWSAVFLLFWCELIEYRKKKSYYFRG